jgi:aspartate racemase
MKVIGLIGGMSWESTVLYYRHINEAVKASVGGLHSARLILYSIDFHTLAQLQREDRWQEAGQLLADAAVALQRAGAECIVVCANTMHIVAPAIEKAVSIPLLHVADATAVEVARNGIATVGLLGTRFTMEQDFYVGHLRDLHGLEVLVPEEADRAEIHRVIYEELCQGQLLDSSRIAFNKIIDRLIARGAKGIILGCTEIAMLINPADLLVPAFDTTKLHALQAVDFATQSGC